MIDFDRVLFQLNKYSFQETRLLRIALDKQIVSIEQIGPGDKWMPFSMDRFHVYFRNYCCENTLIPNCLFEKGILQLVDSARMEDCFLLFSQRKCIRRQYVNLSIKIIPVSKSDEALVCLCIFDSSSLNVDAPCCFLVNPKEGIIIEISETVSSKHYLLPLSSDEKDVLQMSLCGCGVASIADTLAFSESKVKRLRSNICIKLHTQNIQQACVFSRLLGIVDSISLSI